MVPVECEDCGGAGDMSHGLFETAGLLVVEGLVLEYPSVVGVAGPGLCMGRASGL